MEQEVKKQLKAPVIIGIISLIAWIVPFIGFVVSIVGIIVSVVKRDPENNSFSKLGLTLNVIGLLISIGRLFIFMLVTMVSILK